MYAAGLVHLGVAETHSSDRFAIFRRAIPGTPFHDGIGAWPYMWIEDPADIDALYDDFRHLVTLAVVTQPGLVPPGRGNDAVLLKQHFVYDPALPLPPLSRRARARISECERTAAFEVVTDRSGRMVFADLYERLKARRKLTGAFFDKGARHFEAIASLENSVFFRVAGVNDLGAMACGVVFGGMLQVLHMAASETGLHWNASYLLMKGLQDFARENRLLLLTGGMPATGSEGLLTFKSRWANRFVPVYLLRIVNDPECYERLCAARPASANYFPAYREP